MKTYGEVMNKLYDETVDYDEGLRVDEDGVVIDEVIDDELDASEAEMIESLSAKVARLVVFSGRPSDIDEMLDMALKSNLEYTQFTEPQIVNELIKLITIVDNRAGRRERSGLPWTPEEDAQLLAEYQSGMSTRKIAEAHKRSNYAISMRLKDQGIIKEK